MPTRSKPQPEPTPLPPVALTLDELKSPSLSEVARLLRAAEKIWKIKPWKTFDESELFVVQNPDDGQLGFVSVLGGMGETFGIVVYRGADAYFGLLDFLESTEQMPFLPPVTEDAGQMPELSDLFAMMSQLQEAADPMGLFRLSQLHLMFEKKTDLAERDKAWIKDHKHKASGRSFPTFRSLVPGYLPWFVNDAEAAFLATVLEQLIEVAERADFAPELLEVKESGRTKITHELFARVPKTGKTGEITWSDKRIKVSPDETNFLVEFTPDEDEMKRIAALPQGKDILEMDVVDSPMPMGDATERPCFPTLLLMGSKGQVAGLETINCGSGPYRLPLLVDAIVSLLGTLKKRPQKIHFASPDLDILHGIAPEMGIKLQEVKELPTLDPAVESLMEQLTSDAPFGDVMGELNDDESRVLH